MASTTTHNLCIAAIIVLGFAAERACTGTVGARAGRSESVLGSTNACGSMVRTRRAIPPGQDLSDKLNKTDGVICPPNVDSEIKAPAPEIGQDADYPAARLSRWRSERDTKVIRLHVARPLAGCGRG